MRTVTIPDLDYTPQSLPAPEPTPEEERNRLHYLNHAYGIFSWLLTVDHKRIGILYLVTTSIFFAFGAFAVALVRTNLVQPTGAILDLDQYNKAFTAHGTIMIFLFLVPVIPGVLGNFLVPLMIGAKDMAFPKINLLSWYVFMAGALFFLWQLASGGADTGWTLYPPYSSKYSHTNLLYLGLGIFITGFSSILTALNIIATVHKMRAPGMTWSRLPIFIWSMYATSMVQMLATPVLAVTVLLLAVEKVCGIGIFDPALEGDPLLFQHMFWFYSHPAVYIMILPGFAVISEIIPCFSRKNIFGYKAVAWASVGIAVVGFLIWGHHMFVAGQGYYLSLVFSMMTMMVAVPSAIKVFNWTATMYRGDLWFTTPMVLAIGFLFLFTIGGLTGMHLGSSGSDIHLHDTYFVIAHFHFVMVGGYLVAYLAGLHFWWPKMTGRMYSEFWSKTSAMIVIVGFFLTFAPQFVLGYMGMPRRYPNYAPEFQFLNIMSTAGASILGLGYAMVPVYLIASLFTGERAGSNPWRATGLEWQTQSPPPMHNFDEMPITYFAPYEYSLPNGLAQLAAAGKVVEVNGNGNGHTTTHGAHGEVISGS